MRRAPSGMRLARSLGAKEWSRNSYRCLVLVLTFVAYACYHASRKPTSIVKSILDPDSHPPPNYPQHSLSSPTLPWPLGPLFLPPNSLGEPHYHRWAPFNSTDDIAKLDEIDVAFLACYSLGMYAAGLSSSPATPSQCYPNCAIPMPLPEPSHVGAAIVGDTIAVPFLPPIMPSSSLLF